jgi:hypothetical protein
MRKLLIISLLSAVLSIALFHYYGRTYWFPYYLELTGKRSLLEVVNSLEKNAEARLIPYFESAGVSYPPKSITLLAVKDEKSLELWATNCLKPVFIRSYVVKAASGILGPKLSEAIGRFQRAFTS